MSKGKLNQELYDKLKKKHERIMKNGIKPTCIKVAKDRELEKLIKRVKYIIGE